MPQTPADFWSQAVPFAGGTASRREAARVLMDDAGMSLGDAAEALARLAPVAMADGAGAKSDLDAEGRWVTITGQHVHIDGQGRIDAGGHPELRKVLADKAGLHPKGQAPAKPAAKPGISVQEAKARVARGEPVLPLAKAPYDKGSLGISRAQKIALPVVQVPVADMVTVQSTVSPAGVDYFLKGGAAPAVGEPMAPGSKFLNVGPWAVKTPDGKYYMEDGNTRTAALVIQGHKTIPVKVVEIDASGKWVGAAASAPKAAGFAAPPEGAKGDLDPEGHWVTISGNKIHIDGEGRIDAGGHPELRKILADKAGLVASGEAPEPAKPEPAKPAGKPPGKPEPKPGDTPGQKRAAKGGELGPNGEWYKAGAFIATTDMPKKAKQKLDKAATGRVQVDAGRWEVPEPGAIAIISISAINAIGGAVMKNRPQDVQDVTLAYLGISRDFVKDMAARWAKGERWLDAAEHPRLMSFGDAARMVKAGLPLPQGSYWTAEKVAEKLGVKPEQLAKHAAKHKATA